MTAQERKVKTRTLKNAGSGTQQEKPKIHSFPRPPAGTADGAPGTRR